MDLSLDVANQCIWRGDERLDLSPKEFAVFQLLVEHQGSLVTKEQLMQEAWADTFVGDAVLTVVIKQIRDLLGDDARNPRFIETVHRRGFRLIPAVGKGPGRVARYAPGPSPSDPLPPLAPPATLLGRESVFAEIAAAWNKARQGQRQIVFLTGEPGIGKTSVLDAFEAWAGQEPGALVSRGHCLEGYGVSEAYLPVLEAVDGLLHNPGAAPLRDLLRRYSPSWLLQFPWAFPEDERGRVVAQPHGATRERMLRELCAVLERLSESTPVALLLEDLHWSDPSTVSLISLLAGRRHPARLLLLGTYRPAEIAQAEHPLKQVKQHLHAGGLCLDLALEQLSSADVRKLLEARLQGAVASSAVELLRQRSGGNPYFLTSLLAHLRERGVLQERDAVWHARHDPDLAEQIPTDLRETIHQRLDRLPDKDAAVLELASLAGFELTALALAACLDEDVVAVEEACERLARHGDFLRPLPPLSLPDGTVSGRYAFQHALLRDVLYQRIALPRRSEAHRQLGLWGEAHGTSAGELAYHFMMAGGDMVDKAILYAEEAAKRAAAMFAHDEAVRYREAALRAQRLRSAPDVGRTCALLIELAEAQQRAGQIATAEATFFEAAELARQLGDSPLLARAAIGIGQGYPRSQADPSLIRLLEEALRGLEKHDSAARAMVMGMLDVGLGSLPGGEDRRLHLAQDALAMARRLGDPETLAHVLLFARAALHGPSVPGALRAEATEIESLLPRLPDVELSLQLWRVRIVDLIEAGDIEEARTGLAEMTLYADEAQAQSQFWLISLLHTQLALLRGEIDATEKHLQQAIDLGLRTEHPNVMQLTAGYRVALMVERGSLEDLEPLLRMALLQNPNVPSWRAVMAYVCAMLGNLEEARANFEWFAKNDLRDIAKDSVWFVFVSFAAPACRSLGDRRRAAILFDELLPYAERCIGHPGAPSAGHMGRYLGLLAATAGRTREATKHFSRAIERNDAMGAKPWSALTRLDYAEWLLERPAADPRRQPRPMLLEAIAIAEEIGMDGWLPRLRATLARTEGPKPKAAKGGRRGSTR